MQSAVAVKVRLVKATELPFVVDTYWRSRADNERKGKSAKFYFHQKARASLVILWNRGATFHAAVSADDNNHILGWLCSEHGIVHYCYVKSLYRRQGVARTLIAYANLASKSPLLCTHWSALATTIAYQHDGALAFIGYDPPKNLEVNLEDCRDSQQ